MSEIIVFGAGGRGGRAVVGEARRRGHQVTAVVRDTGKHADLATDGVRVVAGDVTDVDSVAKLVPGHDAVVNSTYDLASTNPAEFFVAANHALIEASAGRLVVVGLASVLPAASGELLMDTPGYPQEYRGFYLGHAAGVDTLRAAPESVDWLVLSPAGDFDHSGSRTGRYRLAPADAASRISYADFAIAVLDEIDTPQSHRTQVGVEQG